MKKLYRTNMTSQKQLEIKMRKLKYVLRLKQSGILGNELLTIAWDSLDFLPSISSYFEKENKLSEDLLHQENFIVMERS